MPKITTAYAKNIIRRAFRELVDPSPERNSMEALWTHFNSSCAYCGVSLTRGRKNAHVDHLVSASCGGTNHISNRVLSCARCNEVEKRELPWEEFLKLKCSDEATFRIRKERILKWERDQGNECMSISEDLLRQADSDANEVIALFEQKVIELRSVNRQHH